MINRNLDKDQLEPAAQFCKTYLAFSPVNIWILVALIAMLISFQIVLTQLICRNFGKQLKNEIIYLTAVQFFFQAGFVLRIVLAQDLRSKINSDESYTAWWTNKYQFWFNILPLFYETLPILVVYLHHIKNFRVQKTGA